MNLFLVFIYLEIRMIRFGSIFNFQLVCCVIRSVRVGSIVCVFLMCVSVSVSLRLCASVCMSVCLSVCVSLSAVKICLMTSVSVVLRRHVSLHLD